MRLPGGGGKRLRPAGTTCKTSLGVDGQLALRGTEASGSVILTLNSTDFAGDSPVLTFTTQSWATKAPGQSPFSECQLRELHPRSRVGAERKGGTAGRVHHGEFPATIGERIQPIGQLGAAEQQRRPKQRREALRRKSGARKRWVRNQRTLGGRTPRGERRSHCSLP
jgi:hypothetical protein